MSKSIRQRVSDALSLSGAAGTVRDYGKAWRGDNRDSDMKDRLAIEKAQKAWKEKTGSRMPLNRYIQGMTTNWPLRDEEVLEYNRLRNQKIDEVSQWSEDMGHGEWKGPKN